MNLWFKLEEYKFYYDKINECVYSNREDCAFENDIMI